MYEIEQNLLHQQPRKISFAKKQNRKESERTRDNRREQYRHVSEFRLRSGNIRRIDRLLAYSMRKTNKETLLQKEISYFAKHNQND